jgi:hypothetical protein
VQAGGNLKSRAQNREPDLGAPGIDESLTGRFREADDATNDTSGEKAYKAVVPLAA